jgi:hypothetical protein
MGAQAGFETDESGGASSSDESAVDYYNLKAAVFQENMAAVDREIRELEMVLLRARLSVHADTYRLCLWFQGTHKGYLDELARLQLERDQKVLDAELYHNHRKECVEQWLEEDTKEVLCITTIGPSA